MSGIPVDPGQGSTPCAKPWRNALLGSLAAGHGSGRVAQFNLDVQQLLDGLADTVQKVRSVP